MSEKIWSPKNFKEKRAILAVGLACILLGVAVSLFPIETAVALLAVILISGTIIAMLQYPFAIVILTIILIPFENFLVKFVPTSETLQFALKQVSELLVYGNFMLLVIKRVLNNRFFHRTAIDLWLIFFILAALASTIINAAPIPGSFINLRAILRYTVLFYLVVNLNLTDRQKQKILKIILGIGVFQILLGVLQLGSHGALDSFLLPPRIDFEVAGISREGAIFTQGREIGSIFGTLGDTIFLALFLLIVLAVYLGRANKLNLRVWLSIATILIAINYTFARGVVLASLAMVFIFLLIRWGKDRLIIAAAFLIPFFIVGGYFLVSSAAIYRDFNNPLFEEVGIIDNLTGIFTIDYFERAQNQRLGALLGIPPTVLFHKPLLGFGPDEETTIAELNDSEPNFLYREVVQKGFEDVYWTAILAYFGILGLAAFAMLLLSIFLSAIKIRKQSMTAGTKQIATIVLMLITLTPFLLFFYRVLEFRSFSLYFWLLTGLMFSSYLMEKKDNFNAVSTEPCFPQCHHRD